MTLAEKIAVLRGERKLSQGDLAEKLEVSRQSVSKWETGQAVPELDKIIKLADLFGVTVDELVRDGELPGPEPKTAGGDAEPKIIYVERPRRVELTPVQILGVIGIVTGAALFIVGNLIITRSVWPYIFGLSMLILSPPLLLAKKHPWRIVALLLFLGSYAYLNPYTSGVRWGLLDAIRSLNRCLSMSNFTVWRYRADLFGIAVAMIRSAVTLALAGYAGWQWWKRRKNRIRAGAETDSQ